MFSVVSPQDPHVFPDVRLLRVVVYPHVDQHRPLPDGNAAGARALGGPPREGPARRVLDIQRRSLRATGTYDCSDEREMTRNDQK